MESLKLYNSKTVEKLFSPRKGETKFGEKIAFLTDLETLKKHPAKFVLFGIPEDIGVRANHGKPGTSGAWEACLKSLLNIQHNKHTHPESLIVLGHIDCISEMKKAENIDPTDPNYLPKLGDLTEIIDGKVSKLVETIVSAGKIPIIIGGGHNNAYANIKGSSGAIGKAINVLNIDAHTDLRRLEHRHSGNGFSFARKEGFLGRYTIFGLAQNYTPQYIYDEIEASEQTEFRLFEELLEHSSEDLHTAFLDSLEFVRDEEFGLELDCDVIKDFPASAKTPSGFSIEQVRHFISLAARLPECSYLHVCEAAPTSENAEQVGKALSFFITDFMKTAHGR
ncbi:MAG TPA: formimidoylglutamase [Salegentibacter sp.]|uniref:formimidoylglutamase n=1 Tax=Salegentibacter sp. TaxID=1903072 RepID=UPI002F95A1C8